jgi:hypothetical protein
VPLLGGNGALVLSSFLYAAFMLLWGSLPFAIFSFFLGLLMGWLYLRSRSIMYVGPFMRSPTPGCHRVHRVGDRSIKYLVLNKTT